MSLRAMASHSCSRVAPVRRFVVATQIQSYMAATLPKIEQLNDLLKGLTDDGVQSLSLDPN